MADSTYFRDIQIRDMTIPVRSRARSILSILPGFCGYCGKKYIKFPENGKSCPNGHEGYIDIVSGSLLTRNYYDNVEVTE